MFGLVVRLVGFFFLVFVRLRFCVLGGGFCLFASFVWLLGFNFSFLVPEAVRMLCCFKVLGIAPSFPDFGVTHSLNFSSLVNYA